GLRKDPAAVDALAALAPDLLVVAAYGLILPPRVLDIPRFGAVNVHASLLPAYRGASPITAALLDGRDETGVTIMLMDAGMDTGPMLAQARQSIAPDDTTAGLSTRLAAQGAELLVAILPRWLAGEITPQAQDPALATLCRPLRKEQGIIDWTQPAIQIERAVRAFNPWPAATTTWNGAGLKVLEAAAEPDLEADQPPGTVVTADGRVLVSTGAGLLRLERVQLAGRSAMAVSDFLRGQPDFVGARLGAA
ncbi:MAG: methionyl-tRNA formyltransferase, partial [Anaerolineae bacterium]|nr:methionyl-tRNA formyltransferase [Anaerolineae bacterium]